MKAYLQIIVQRGRERPPIVSPSEIAAPTVSRACLSETNQKLECPKLWLKTSARNLVRDATEPLISPMSRRLCSILAIGAFGQEPVASTLFDCGISALVDRQRLSPISSIKASRRQVFTSLPYENEMFEILLANLSNVWDDDDVLQQARRFFGRKGILKRIY
jgi:hypothetical protein